MPITSNPPYAIWSIWLYLPLLSRFVFLGLCAVCIYSIYSAAVTKAHLLALTNAPQADEIAPIRGSLSALRNRCTKLQQLIGVAFYLFVLVLFLDLQRAVVEIPDSKAPAVGFIMNMMLYVAFAANAFFVLLIIHLVQWFVSARIDAYASRLNTEPVA